MEGRNEMSTETFIDYPDGWIGGSDEIEGWWG